ncbi:MAG: 2-dehydropantoate 2-reductase, partial [Roseiarcus sp.]
MRIAVFGAGAIGGLLAARISAAGAEVTVIARGPHLAAMQANGLTLRSGGRTLTVRPRCLADAAEAGVQEAVIVTLKAHALPAAAPAIATMMGPQTSLVTAINGVPYWYFYGLEGPWRDRRLNSVDPGGRLWDILPPSRAIGAIVYPAAEVVEPGVIEHTYGDRFSLGE